MKFSFALVIILPRVRHKEEAENGTRKTHYRTKIGHGAKMPTGFLRNAAAKHYDNSYL